MSKNAELLTVASCDPAVLLLRYVGVTPTFCEPSVAYTYLFVFASLLWPCLYVYGLRAILVFRRFDSTVKVGRPMQLLFFCYYVCDADVASLSPHTLLLH